MSEEIIRTVIPRISFGVENYALVITSRRIALIKTGIDYSQIVGLIGALTAPGGDAGSVAGGYYIGSKIGEKFTGDEVDFKGRYLNSLIGQDISNIEIYLNRITEIRLFIEDGVYKIKVFGLSNDDKIIERINGDIVPLISDIKANKKAGYKLKEIYRSYALECQKRFEYYLGDKLTQKYF